MVIFRSVEFRLDPRASVCDHGRVSSPSDRRQGLVGYATLAGLCAAGLGGAAVLGGLGLQAYFAAAQAPVTKAGEARALVSSLEGALVLWCFGVLALCVAITAFVVLLKALSDDVSRARRGPGERAPDEAA